MRLESNGLTSSALTRSPRAQPGALPGPDLTLVLGSKRSYFLESTCRDRPATEAICRGSIQERGRATDLTDPHLAVTGGILLASMSMKVVGRHSCGAHEH
jgi:hypothetical protein